MKRIKSSEGFALTLLFNDSRNIEAEGLLGKEIFDIGDTGPVNETLDKSR